MKTKRRKKNGSVFKMLIFIFCFYCTWNIVSTQVKIKKQIIVLEQIKDQCAEQQRDNDELANMIMLETNEKYIKKIARDKLGFVSSDERVFVDISSK